MTRILSPRRSRIRPSWLGGAAKDALTGVVDHADGWLPNVITRADLEKARKELDRLALAAGRDPKLITITVYGQEATKDVERPRLDDGRRSRSFLLRKYCGCHRSEMTPVS